MTIGDDIFTILGMMPIRDRAGIQRATMADEAVKASSPNAEGQSLTRQGMAPPQFQLPLPDNVPTAYASGRGDGGQPSPAPVPQERVVAASPAAAPSPKVQRGSDMILAEMEKRKRAEDMNGVFASLALLANGFRGGGGDGSSRNALVEQAFGGGSKAPTVAEMIALQNLRTQEGQQIQKDIGRKQFIDLMQRSNGMSADQASAIWEAGKAGDYVDPKTIATREADRQTAGARARILADPKLIKEISDNYGISPELVTEHLKAGGAFDAKSIAELAQSRGVTAKAAADAAKTAAETKAEQQAAMSFEEAKRDPVEFAKRYPQLDTPEKIAAATANRATYEEFTKKAVPNATQHLQEWTQDELRRKQLGLPSRSLPEFVASMQPRHTDTPEEATAKQRAELESKHGYGGELEKLKEQRNTANDARSQVKTVHEVQQAAWTPDIITGPWAKYELPVRRALASAFGHHDVDVSDTGRWQATMKQGLIQLQKDMKGSTSNNDVKLVADAQGSEDWDPQTIKRIQQLREITAVNSIKDYNDNVETFYKRNPNAPKGLYQPEEYPMPGRLIMDDLARPENQKLSEIVRTTPDRLVPFEGRKITVSELVRRNFGAHTLYHMQKGDL